MSSNELYQTIFSYVSAFLLEKDYFLIFSIFFSSFIYSLYYLQYAKENVPKFMF